MVMCFVVCMLVYYEIPIFSIRYLEPVVLIVDDFDTITDRKRTLVEK